MVERKRPYGVDKEGSKANGGKHNGVKKNKSQTFKRKKIRKILTEDKLQEETLRALKEEEERQKRLGIQAQLARGSTKTPENVPAQIPLAMPNDGVDFDEFYNLDLSDMNGLNYENGATSASELASLLDPDSSFFGGAQMSVTDESIPTSSASLKPDPGLKQTLEWTAPGGSLTSEVENLFREEPDRTETPSSVHRPPMSNGHFPPSTMNNVTPAVQAGADFKVTMATLNEPPLAPVSVQSLLSQTVPTSSSRTPSPPSVIKARLGAKPKSSDEVICISSESSDDNASKQRVTEATGPKNDLIHISSGSESSDDVIFAGTDDNEIVEDDPDVNNSGMHVDDATNQPDEEGRVLINKNKPPEEEDIFLSESLAKSVKPHQIGGIRFMFDNIVESLEHFRKSSGFGCILAHSMGLGKTLQVIAFIDLFLRHTGAKTALCVVPVNTLLNWVTEFEYWIPSRVNGKSKATTEGCNFKVSLLSDMHKTTEIRAQIISSWKREGGVLLMGYEMFRLLTNQKVRRKQKRKQKRPQQAAADCVETIDLDEEDRILQITSEIYRNLVNPGPDLIVCDEGHRIKNSQASISQALKQIATKRRIVLTGYPLQNNLLEYWCMVDFVRPSFLGTKQEFSNMFERPILNGQCADSNTADIKLMKFRSHVLHSLLKGFVQRRSHIVLKNSLPPKEEYVLMIRLSTWQKKLYNHFIKKQMKNSTGSWYSVLNPIKAFSICCKIWNHPDVLYRTVLQKTLEEQQNSNMIDMDLDLPDSLMDVTLNKSKRKKRDISNIQLSDIVPKVGTSEVGSTPDTRLIQTPGTLNPFGTEEKEKGLNYEWAKDLLQDYSPNLLEVSGKMLMLMEIVRLSVSSGDKILVFSQSLMTLNLIEEFLAEVKVPDPPGSNNLPRKWRKNDSYFRLDGNTNTSEREKMINAFNAKDNNKIHLFLLSTRAGCLGINLVGANRVVVFDISWNPCHDAQAVCRVYRYGQTKKCVIYRLICDQTMEKKIYDRQISKQGMADRVVDELNPIQSLDRQDITKLLIFDDEEPDPVDMKDCDDCNDDILVQSLKTCGSWLTKKPFHHESLLMDCKSQRLTKAEKRAAQKGYEQEKRASSSCNYSRHSYAGFYSTNQSSAVGKPNQVNVLPYSAATSGNPPGNNVRPLQSTPYPIGTAANMMSAVQPDLFDQQTIEYLQRAGINIRKIIASADVPLPNSSQNSSQVANKCPLVSAGQPFYIINGRKGTYIGTTNGRIFALRSQKQDLRNTPSPLVRSSTGQMVTVREQESQAIKAVFSSLVRPPQQVQHPRMAAQYPQQQAIRPGYQYMKQSMDHTMPGRYIRQPGQMLTQQSSFMSQQMNPMTMQNHTASVAMNMMNQQNQMMNLHKMVAQPRLAAAPQGPVVVSSSESSTSMDERAKFDDILDKVGKSYAAADKAYQQNGGHVLDPSVSHQPQQNYAHSMNQQIDSVQQQNYSSPQQSNFMLSQQNMYDMSSMVAKNDSSIPPASTTSFPQFPSPLVSQAVNSGDNPAMETENVVSSSPSATANNSNGVSSYLPSNQSYPMQFPSSVNQLPSNDSYLMGMDTAPPTTTDAPPSYNNPMMFDLPTNWQIT